MTEKRIVIVGSGVAGKTLAAELMKKRVSARISIIDAKDYMEVPFAQLRALTDPDGFGKKIRKPLADLLPGAELIHAQAVGIDSGGVKLDNGLTVNYDWLILATGSSYGQWPFLNGEEPTVREREKSLQAEGQKVAEAKSILIIGGGPVGVELAGEIAYKWPEKEVTIVQGGDRLLNGLSQNMSARAMKIMEKLGVKLHTNKKLSRDSSGTWTDADGAAFTADVVVPAVGIDINTRWISDDGSIPKTEKGSIEVGSDLRVKGQANIFALGDINDVPEIKLGAFAVIQGKLTANNLVSLLENPNAPLKGYKPHGPMGLVTLGPKYGAVQMPFGHPHFLAFIKQKDFFAGKYLKTTGQR